MDDLVSIIMPAYNAEKYISESINSVLNQTYQNWELLIVDDCSTDNTKDIIKKYSLYDTRIIPYYQSSNKGVAAARNKAIELSKGRFIAFLDSDDLWYEKKLQIQIEFMKTKNIAFSFTTYDVFVDNDPTIINTYNAVELLNYEDYLKNTLIGCLTVVMDKSLIGTIKSEDGYLEDVKTWMKYLKSGYSAYGLDISLAKYRIHRGSTSSNKIKNAIRYFDCLYNFQNLSLIRALYFELNYLFNAIKKRIKRKTGAIK